MWGSIMTCFPVKGQVDHVTWYVFKEMDTYGQEVSDWEKYAAEEYDILVAEEAANDQCNDV